MSITRIKYLLQQYVGAGLTDAETAELTALLATNTASSAVPPVLQELLYETPEDHSVHSHNWQPLLDSITAIDKKAITQLPDRSKLHFISKRKWIAAAILIFAIGSGIYYLNNQSYKSQKSSQITVQTKGTGSDIPPGTNKAIWTLTNGKQIELDSTVLDMTSPKEPSNIGYNELRTPRGGQYQLILPDGSKVWLNAASSIKYPVAFEGKDRRVEVSGEAYFEVTKDVAKPFKVKGGGQEIEVLGTSFNVHVYNDEPFKTSLVEGSVKINQLILKPGQAYLNGKVIETNIEQDVAWKAGLFNFNNADLPTVMKQLERWYDIEVEYPDGIPSFTFQGKLYRTANLAKVLNMLKDAEVKYTIEGRKLIITR